jgi:hypothetical protein
MSEQVTHVSGVHVEPRDLFRLYLDGDHTRLSVQFLGVLDYLNQTTYLELDDSNRAGIIQFVKTFLTLFTQPDFIIPEQHVHTYVTLNELISNLVAMTPFHNTDGFLELLRYQPSNLAKILTLYSARNRVRFDRRQFFDAHAHLATLWWCRFCSIYKSGLVSEEVCQHMAEHLAYHDERMMLTQDVAEPYFGSTYVDGVIDRHVKPFLNSVVRRSTRLNCENRPNPRKIAIISDLWSPTHSVYRNYYKYVKSLREKFHLTFFHCLRHENLDTSLFDEVHRLEFADLSLNVEKLRSNDFSVVYFPDVGMSLTSIMLANYRIAPIQMCGLGHSVSTWGADIDYFVSGVETELPELPERNYSERLLLLPGMGVIHNLPNYEPTGRKKSVPEVVINFPSSGQKLNASFLRTFGKLIDRLKRPVRLRFFPAVLDMANSYIPFMSTVREALGGRAVILDIMPFLKYPEYMAHMEEGDLTLDTFHFGGCNVAADSLFVRKPFVAWQGDKWYNRISSAMLRRAGLDELICNGEAEYLETSLRLIHDDKWREELTQRLRETDLHNTVFGDAEASSFRRAVEYLIANHDRIKTEPGRKPLRIL